MRCLHLPQSQTAFVVVLSSLEKSSGHSTAPGDFTAGDLIGASSRKGPTCRYPNASKTEVRCDAPDAPKQGMDRQFGLSERHPITHVSRTAAQTV